MQIRLTYLDRETLLSHPRFWFRLAFSLFFGLMNFLYAVGYSLDFLDPSYQRLGLGKLLFYTVGSVLVSECVFHVQKDLGAWLRQSGKAGETVLLAMGAGIAMAIVLMLLMMQAFEAVFGEPMVFEDGWLVGVVLFSAMIIFGSVYLLITTVHSRKYPLEILVEEAGGWTVLEVKDVAHILCWKNSFLFTYHSGARYEVELEENLEELFAMLHPGVFFMVNDQVVVSRRGCGQVLEGKDGSIKIVLRPKVKLPGHMKGKIDLQGME